MSRPFKGPAEVYFVRVKFSKPTGGRGFTAGVKGGRVATLQYALDRKAACLGYDPHAEVHIYRSSTTWTEVDE